ncbi:MAG: hypothetical protein K5784_03675 [Clostridiales bacterium]|nr:hypothetical protein [Clostridiales bacterium]
MKKILITIILLAVMAAFAETGMPNPITEYAFLDEINSVAGTDLIHPAAMGVNEESFSVITTNEGVIAQYKFTVAGFGYTFRGSKLADDISGVYVNGKSVFGNEAASECEFYYGDGFMLSRWKSGVNQYTLYMEDPDGIMDRETFRLISWEMQDLTGYAGSASAAENEISALTGEYEDSFSQRAWAEVSMENGECLIKIHWADSASEYYLWTMTLSQEGDKLTYDDGVCCSITTLEDGTERLITVYDSASGYFTLSGTKLKWNGAENDYCRDCVFEKTAD